MADQEKSYLDDLDLDQILGSLDSDETDEDEKEETKPDVARLAAEAVIKTLRDREETDKKSPEPDKKLDEKSELPVISLDQRIEGIEKAVSSMLNQTTETARSKYLQSSQAKILAEKENSKLLQVSVIPGYDITKEKAINDLLAAGKVDQAIAYADEIIKANKVGGEENFQPSPDVPDYAVRKSNDSVKKKKALEAAKARLAKLSSV